MPKSVCANLTVLSYRLAKVCKEKAEYKPGFGCASGQNYLRILSLKWIAQHSLTNEFTYAKRE
jgi:hypothetical protein